jgi:2,4-dienoyl-CoA reductase-like NADH-dependent reductase (Old Yellow Enzyme family)
MKYPINLFDKFSQLGLKNRAVMAPMTRVAADKDGFPLQKLVDYYIRKSNEDIGLIIIESAAINNESAKGYLNGLQFHNTQHAQTWKPIVHEIKKSGAKIWIQLFHAGRLSVKEITGNKPFAPSSINLGKSTSFWRNETEGKILHFQTETEFAKPVEISKKEIISVIKSFSNACALAEEAGFDGVELHGAHGYLIHQFFQPTTNIRKDEYEATSFKFIEDLVVECRKSVSKSFTLSYRLSSHFVDNPYIRINKVRDNFIALIKKLDTLHIDVFHCSEIDAHQAISSSVDSITKLVTSNTEKPVITCGKIDELKKVDFLLNSGHVDLVAFGRNLISNNDLLHKISAKKTLTPFQYSKHFNVF